MKKLQLLMVVIVVGHAAIAQESCQDRMSRVRAVADSVCSITNIAPYADAASIIQVDFVLKPEPGSDIRCQVALPPPERWNGRLWGSGNSGYAGKVPKIRKRYTGDGSAAMTTDCGTWSITDCGESNTNIWPMAIIRDYSWRATHLMTVYGKRIVEAYYGKPPKRSYFCGGSCGGRQAYCEAVRYPEDYDGIIATLPANNPIANEIANWLLWRNTHDGQGRLLFTVEEMRAVSDAAVEYKAATDPKPYAGRFLADGRVDEATLDGMLALAAKKMPSLAEGDKLARLKAIYSPTFVDGECRCLGFAPGTYLGKNMMQKRGAFILSWMRQTYGITAAEWQRVTWKEVLEYVRRMGPMFNANATDLSRFFARGGKLISNTGWEDQSISPYPIIEHYERMCAREGGLEKTMEHCRLFCIPGGAHGGGKGRAMAGGPDDGTLRQALVKWVEEGVAPERLPNVFKQMKASKKVVYPEIAAYPGLLVQDDAGKWMRVERPRSKPQLADWIFNCDVSAEP